MSSLVFSLLAACCSALSSLIFRKNNDVSTTSGSPTGYLVLFYFLSFIISLLVFPAIWNGNVNYVVVALGLCVGILTSTLMVVTSRALQQGPAGLTFAFHNASAIFPSLILFVLLGSEFGFSYSYIQLAGMALVLYGLFLGAKNETAGRSQASARWLQLALGCFIIQILALTFIQARCLLYDSHAASTFFSDAPFTEADDIWFMPGMFGAAFVMQTVLFLHEKRRFQKSEVIYGCLGGVANFASTCLLLLATKYALPFEQAILFPCFAVGSMILCNVWSNRLYNEKFNLRTNALCSFGIFMAASS